MQILIQPRNLDAGFVYFPKDSVVHSIDKPVFGRLSVMTAKGHGLKSYQPQFLLPLFPSLFHILTNCCTG